MCLKFQIILSIGLILSTSAEINHDQVINYLSSTNLPQAQNAFHNCIANLNIKSLEKMDYNRINQFLKRMSDEIISCNIYPEKMSEKIIEFLKLDISNIEKKFEECCTIFHSSLFAVEKPKFDIKDDLKTYKNLLESRFYQANKILDRCLSKYGTGRNNDGHNKYTETSILEVRAKLLDCTFRNIDEIIFYNLSPVNGVRRIKAFYLGSKKYAFAEYCVAVYYTYLIFNDSTFHQNLGTSDRTQ
ncbi:uncharacterized protein LOC126908644 [Daktulosphaira vitifoliae]|uniref:uncharacterized protein LOC126908644 n=1 Tax=Daktulosphaira vitifoliae TaxID=58002 RepID=UPI0021A98C89|nr:uncharacterized protein LOC126908644 [Daktulosphaira vitifoliae]